jgi:hypothetical protein
MRAAEFYAGANCAVVLVSIVCKFSFRFLNSAEKQMVFRFLSKKIRRKESCMHGALNEVYL